MLQSARTTYAISAETIAGSILSSANLREDGVPVGKQVRFARKRSIGTSREDEYDAGSARRLRIRGFAGMRSGRTDRYRTRTVADGLLSMDGEIIYRAKDLKVGQFRQGTEPA